MKNVTKIVLAAVVVLLLAGTAAAGSGEFPESYAAAPGFYTELPVVYGPVAGGPVVDGPPGFNAPAAADFDGPVVEPNTTEFFKIRN